MKYGFRSIAIACLTLGFCLSGSAAAKYLACPACTHAGYKAKARTAGPGDHVVYDLVQKQVKAFRVERDAETGLMLTLPMGVSPSIKDVFDALSDYYAETGGAMSKVVTVRADALGVNGLGGANVYDVLGDFNLRSRMADRLAPHNALPGNAFEVWNGIVEAVAAAGFSFAGFQESASIQIRVEFIDGSSIVFDSEIGNYAATPISGSARTAEGNAIPEANAAMYAGNWLFSTNEGENFVSWLGNIGATLGYDNSGRIIESVRCSWDGVTLHCRVKYRPM